MPNRPTTPRPLAPGVLTGVLVATVALLAATLGRPPGAPVSGGPAYLGADGLRVRYTNSTGSRASEWAVDQAGSVLNSGPPAAFAWFAGRNWENLVVARLTTVQSSVSGQVSGHDDTFFTVQPDGVHTEVEASATTRLFSPARLELATQMAPGRTWTSKGTLTIMTGNQSHQAAYQADFAATAPTDAEEVSRRCLVVTMHQSVGGALEPPVTRTWCPRAGIVAVTDASGSWRASSDQLTAPVTAPTDFDWSSADRLTFGSHTINVVGANTVLAHPSVPPGILSDGTLVAVENTSAETLGLNTAVEPVQVSWRARSSGENTASATFNDQTLIASTSRELVSYDAAGRWQWQATLPDVTQVPPVRLGNLAVVASLDGSLTAYDLATGTERWSHRLNAEVRVPLAVRGDRVVALDQTGTLACFDLLGNRVWSEAIDAATQFAISEGANPCIVIPASTTTSVLGLSLADGSQLWRTQTLLSAAGLIGLDGQVVLRDGASSAGLDAATGAVRWTWSDARTYAGIGGGDRLLLATADRLVLLNAQGQQLREWPVSVGSLASGSAYLNAAAGRVQLFGPSGISLGVAQ